MFCVRRVRIAPVPPCRVWGGNTRISDENGLQDMKKKINTSSFALFFVIFVHLNTVHDEKENFSDIVLGLHGIEVGGKPCVSGRGKAGGGTFLP